MSFAVNMWRRGTVGTVSHVPSNAGSAPQYHTGFGVAMHRSVQATQWRHATPSRQCHPCKKLAKVGCDLPAALCSPIEHDICLAASPKPDQSALRPFRCASCCRSYSTLPALLARHGEQSLSLQRHRRSVHVLERLVGHGVWETVPRQDCGDPAAMADDIFSIPVAQLAQLRWGPAVLQQFEIPLREFERQPTRSRKVLAARDEFDRLCNLAATPARELVGYAETVLPLTTPANVSTFEESCGQIGSPQMCKLLELKVEGLLTYSMVDLIGSRVLGLPAVRGSARDQVELFSQRVTRNRWDSRFNSLLGWVRLLFSLPAIEVHFLVPDLSADPPTVVREYVETAHFGELFKSVASRHRSLGRVGSPNVLALGIYHDKHEWFRSQMEAFFAVPLNCRRTVLETGLVHMLLRECSNSKENSRSMWNALIPELIIGYEGVEVWCGRENALVWVYLLMDLQCADTQAQYVNLSVTSPSGSHCCLRCLASNPEDFSLLRMGQLRTIAGIQAHIRKAIAQRTWGDVKKELRLYGLTAAAPFNPNLHPVGDYDVVPMQSCDVLHMQLNDARAPALHLRESRLEISGKDLLVLEERLKRLHEIPGLSYSKVPVSVRVSPRWHAYDGYNWSVFAPVTLPTLVSSRCQLYWDLCATLHFLLSAKEIVTTTWAQLIPLLFAKQRVALHEWLPGNLTVSKGQKRKPVAASVCAGEGEGKDNKDDGGSESSSDSGDDHQTFDSHRGNQDFEIPDDWDVPEGFVSSSKVHAALSSHNPLHLPSDFRRYGPAANFSSSVGEHVQGIVGAIAEDSSRDAETFAHVHATARSLHLLLQANAHPPPSLLHTSDEVELFGKGVKYFGLPLCPGNVVCQLLDSWDIGAHAATLEQTDLPLIKDLFRFVLIQSINVKALSICGPVLVIPPAARLPMHPFPLIRSGCSEVVPFSKCSRVVLAGPLFLDHSSSMTSETFVIPTVAL